MYVLNVFRDYRIVFLYPNTDYEMSMCLERHHQCTDVQLAHVTKIRVQEKQSALLQVRTISFSFSLNLTLSKRDRKYGGWHCIAQLFLLMSAEMYPTQLGLLYLTLHRYLIHAHTHGHIDKTDSSCKCKLLLRKAKHKF